MRTSSMFGFSGASAGLGLARAVAALLFFAPSVLGAAQAEPGARVIHSVFVEAADKTGSSTAVDRRLIEKIRKSSNLKLASDAKDADAVLRVSAVIWPAATYAPNPRSTTTVVGEYQGYASADLTNRTDQPMWSYLVTPSRFHVGGAAEDLADQIFDGLRGALKAGAISSASGVDSVAPGASGSSASLRVAGATFPAPLYRRWFESYAERSGGAPIAYDAVGSVAGVDALTAGKIDMAASDIPAGSSEPDTLRFPTVVGGVVPIFNLPRTTADLNLTPEVLAAIYAGTIKRWNDPRIRAANRAARLPDAEIAVVHRSDGSGTTFVWTSFLAASSADWKARAGATVNWPVGLGEKGNEGVAAEVQATTNSIGYVELTYAIQHRLRYASVKNPVGRFIRADLASLTEAAQNAGRAHSMSLIDTPGANAYPIATFTYFLVRKSEGAKERGEIAEFLRWMLTAGQKQCASLGYAPLPKELADAELQELQGLK